MPGRMHDPDPIQGEKKPLTPDEGPRRAEGVRVAAPARLHLGFIDMNGGLGRRFGSLGLTIDAFTTRVRVEATDADAPRAPDAAASSARAQRYLERCAEAWGLDPAAWRVVVEEFIPQHMGLGSGTQMALAVGTALGELAGCRVPARELATLLDRGARSSTGLGGFTGGGLILDGGRARGAHTIPPILARHEVPRDWRVVLILDDAHRGLHGENERAAFTELPPFPAEQAAELCRMVLMQLLPAVQEGDVNAFGSAVTTLQDRVGDHFSAVQGGRYTSAGVAECLEWLRTQPGVAGVGQSSWGPTGFALVGDPQTAESVRAALAQRHPDSGLHFLVTGIRNAGARTERLTTTRSSTSASTPRTGAAADSG